MLTELINTVFFFFEAQKLNKSTSLPSLWVFIKAIKNKTIKGVSNFIKLSLHLSYLSIALSIYLYLYMYFLCLCVCHTYVDTVELELFEVIGHYKRVLETELKSCGEHKCCELMGLSSPLSLQLLRHTAKHGIS